MISKVLFRGLLPSKFPFSLQPAPQVASSGSKAHIEFCPEYSLVRVFCGSGAKLSQTHHNAEKSPSEAKFCLNS